MTLKTEQASDDEFAANSKFSRYYREILPAHCTFKINSFSDLLKSNATKHQSDEFWASGFNWRVSVYPKGRNKGDEDYLSMYLEIVDTYNLPPDFEVYVSYKLFVYDHLKDMYYTVQDADGKIRRFRSTKMEWGVDRFLCLQTITDPSNGYIRDDFCIFGAEVFIIKHSGLTDAINLYKHSGLTDAINLYIWEIEKFSTIKDKEYYDSKFFVAGGYSWYLSMHPSGHAECKNQNLSLFLRAGWAKRNPRLRLYAEFKLRMKNQLNNDYNVERICQHWFCASSIACGSHTFVSLVDLNKASNGFLVNDKIIFEVEMTALSLIKN
ncbi:hypothetical protein LguiA_021477 [Lonicera macranthoides]